MTRERINAMEKDFSRSDVKNLLQVEFCLHPDSEEYGMTGTGLFIVNPPWQLESQLSGILPYLKAKLGEDQTTFTLKKLIEE